MNVFSIPRKEIIVRYVDSDGVYVLTESDNVVFYDWQTFRILAKNFFSTKISGGDCFYV